MTRIQLPAHHETLADRFLDVAVPALAALATVAVFLMAVH